MALTVGIIGKFFITDEEKDDVLADAPDTEAGDYSRFATGSPLFSENEILISAKSVILCTDGGMLLYEKQADVPLPMASITKVMTAIVALEELRAGEVDIAEKLRQEVSVSERAVGVEGSSVYLRAGEKVSYEMLLYSLMLESANDAATAIAYAVAGSEEAFVELMNKKAQALCMDSTVFKNPHGLSADGHYTTARNYARLMSYALNDQLFTEMIGTKKKVYRSEDGAYTRVLTNHNRLLSSYKNIIGGKTGFTKLSGRTLVTAAEKDGTRLICVTINAPDDWNDHTKLFEKGFEVLKTVTLTPSDCSFSVPTACGSEAETLIGLKKEIRLTVNKDTEVSLRYFCPNILFAPVLEGKAVGRLEIYAGNEKIQEAALYVQKGVSGVKQERKALFERLTELLAHR